MEIHSHPQATMAVKTGRYMLVMLLIITLNFLIPRLMPGDPLLNIIGEEAYYSAGGALETLREGLGLNQPFAIQYFSYLGGVFTGDWGYSYLYMEPVLTAVMGHLGWSLVLVLPAIILAAIAGAFSGSIAAWRRK
ncbi:MAG: ABC transporter permease, partial [Dehalococcoidaceae bacterium]|nr:ABC transporter permease [Dehalococcoidaceae bacterium]